MSKVERRHERAIAVLKTIARAMANAAFRVADYPGSKRTSAAASSARAVEGDNRRGNSER